MYQKIHKEIFKPRAEAADDLYSKTRNQKMASVRFYASIDMTVKNTWEIIDGSFSSTLIHVWNYAYDDYYDGNFTYNRSGVSGGTVNVYREYYQNTLTTEVTGLSISAKKLISLILLVKRLRLTS
jgi:hypothetical protein